MMAKMNVPAKAGASAVSSHDRILLAAKQLFSQRGYENTSTVAIARQAGTSESQLMKHFGSKEGLLEAIFERGWTSLAPEMARAKELDSPRARLRALLEVVVGGLERDPELMELMMLEARRVRREANQVLVTTGFLQLIRIVDECLAQAQQSGQLKVPVKPETVRSGLIGMFEGLLRDMVLARRTGFPANYTKQDVSVLFDTVIAALLK
jgi:AcrR family transcriptional regulator